MKDNNKDDFKRSKIVPSSTAILIARYIYTCYEHEAIWLPKTDSNIGAPKNNTAYTCACNLM